MGTSLLVLFIGIIVIAATMTIVTNIGHPTVMILGIPLGIVLMVYGFIRMPNHTDQEKCERSGFTWQVTDELIKSGDNYVFRGYCINL